MSATEHEQEFAQVSGVKIKHWVKPMQLIGKDGAIAASRLNTPGSKTANSKGPARPSPSNATNCSRRSDKP